jgi:DNA-binding response OmpR family regulator
MIQTTAQRAGQLRHLLSGASKGTLRLVEADTCMKVLFVDDDRDLIDLLIFASQRAGFDSVYAYEAQTALQILEAQRPDIVVLDINLRGENGMDLLREIRRRDRTPVLMLTSSSSEDDKVRALNAGADDYLTKPFSHRELIARLQAVLRRATPDWSPPHDEARVITVGPFTLDLAQHAGTKNGVPLKLTVTEFRLLHFLMLNAGSVVPTRVLLKQVWGYTDSNSAAVARVALHRLRSKIEDDPANPQLIQTIAGVGAMLKTEGTIASEPGYPGKR